VQRQKVIKIPEIILIKYIRLYLCKKLPFRVYLILTLSLLFSACENDIEKINMLNASPEYPDSIGDDVEMIYSDSAKVKVHLYAKELKQYDRAEKPYIEFPQGMRVYFYNDSMEIESEIKSNYAIYYNEEKLWKGTGNVILRNLKTGERLDTEELFWDEGKEEIYSRSYTRIVTDNEILHSQNGFRSNQELTDYELIGNSGKFNIEEDE
jgi:LPS export ABC transporter protein LptC